MQETQQQGIGVQRILKNFTKAIIEKGQFQFLNAN